MRVAVLTQVREAADAYDALLPALGHQIVVTIVPSTNRDLFAGATGEIVFPESKTELAPILRSYDPDVGLCTGFPWLIPQEVLDVPRLGIVNSHPTLLPKGRGPHPWAWAVRTGETELGVTFHYMDAAFDTGNVLAQMRLPFAEEKTQETLFPKLGDATRALLPEVFAKLEAGDAGVPQGHGEYQPQFEPEYAVVDTTQRAADVHRQVRAWSWVPPRNRVGPLLDGERLVQTSLVEVAGARRIECGDGPLWIVESEPA